MSEAHCMLYFSREVFLMRAMTVPFSTREVTMKICICICIENISWAKRKFNEFLYALLFSKQREVGKHHAMYLPWELTLLLEIYSTDKREHKVRYEIGDMIFKVTQSRKRKIYDRCVTVHLNQSTLTVRMLLVPVETLLGSTLFSQVVIDSVHERSATVLWITGSGCRWQCNVILSHETLPWKQKSEFVQTLG